MEPRVSRGFSVPEVAVAFATLGVVVACSAPAYVRYRDSRELQGAVKSLVSHIRQTRVVALRTGVDQPMVFETDPKGAVFKTMSPNGTMRTTGRLPNTIMYDAGTSRTVTLTSNGRADRVGTVVLCNYGGNSDTVRVARDGFVISH
jgi:Tfp pilus assembly protein FimT